MLLPGGIQMCFTRTNTGQVMTAVMKLKELLLCAHEVWWVMMELAEREQ